MVGARGDERRVMVTQVASSDRDRRLSRLSVGVVSGFHWNCGAPLKMWGELRQRVQARSASGVHTSVVLSSSSQEQVSELPREGTALSESPSKGTAKSELPPKGTACVCEQQSVCISKHERQTTRVCVRQISCTQVWKVMTHSTAVRSWRAYTGF